MFSSRCRPLVATVAISIFGAAALEAQQRPNVVVVLADDLGYGDVRTFHPASKIPTPHLDALAAAGMRFTDAHSPSAVCTPTRYALLTGRYAWRTRLKRGVLFPPRDKPLIKRDRPTLGTLFGKSGYRTACVGKWHLGIEWARDEANKVDFNAPFTDGPTTRGFDEFFGIAASLDMVPYAYLQQDRPTAPVTEKQPGIRFPRFVRKGPRATDFDPGEVLDKITERACEFIARGAKADKPFFLYFPLTAPHKPVWPAERFRGRTEYGPYGDFIVETDDVVGRIVAAIEKAGVTDNTLVLFTSDNGSFMFRKKANEDDHVVQERIQGYRVDRHQSNGKWRGTKADIYEGGHRVPFVVKWPSRVKAKQSCDSTICHVDLYATFAGILGAEPGPAPVDSYSFESLLEDPLSGAHRRPPVIHHSVNGTFAIRDGRYKLVLSDGSGGRQKPKGKPFQGPFQLFDLEKDPSEKDNVAESHPELVARLTAVVRGWQAGAPSVPVVTSDLLHKVFDGRSIEVDSAWNRFRGPNGNGIDDRHPLPSTLGPEAVVWRKAVPLGHSSPVVWGDRIYITGIVENDLLVTVCKSLATGETLWDRKAPRPRKEKFDRRNNAASPTPFCDAHGVVVFFPDYGMVAYDHQGQEQWRQALGPFDNIYGMGASPIGHGNRVFLPCDQQNGSYLVAFERTKGDELWRAPRPWALSGHCTPILYPKPSDAKARLILPGSFYLDAYDVTNGARKWFVGGLACEMKSTPVIDEDRILINGYASPLNQPGNQVEVPAFAAACKDHDKDGNGRIEKGEMPRTRARMYFEFVDRNADGSLEESDWKTLQAALASQNGMLAIRAGGQGDCTETHTVWAQRRSVPQLPSPLLYRGVIYMLGDQSGLISLLDPKTGERILRGRLKDAQDSYYASPVAGDGKVYFVSQGGLISVVRAGKELESLAVHDLGEQCYATPAIVDGKLLVRTTKTLYCWSAQ